MNKVEAKKRGLTQYRGNPCGKCGSRIRRTCNGGCQKCHTHRVKVREREGGDLYERKLNRNREARYRRKSRVFAHYGVVCAICGFDDMRALTIDHVNQKGAAHVTPSGRRRIGQLLYRWLVANKFPTGFRTLCCNCQAIAFAEYEGRDKNNLGGNRMRGKWRKGNEK